MAQRFARENGWSVASVDLAESSTPGVHSVVLTDTSEGNVADVREALRAWAEGAGSEGKVHAVVHAAGSWAGSAVDADDFAASLEHLWSANVRSAALAVSLLLQLAAAAA